MSIISNSLDEIKKRENALKIIENITFNKGRKYLFDLTGLSGGFIASSNDLNLLETYVGPAIFENQLEIQGKIHLGGEKVLGVNRTSSGILATILALVKKNSNVLHFVPEKPSHPSIPRSCKLICANYYEFDNINDFKLLDNTSLIIITGSTMDHKVISEDIFLKIIKIAKENNIPVFVDDASGARLRTAVFNQKRAWDLGVDLVITSTDKLMNGPRGGLLAGKKELIDLIKVKANEFGLEAQGSSILAMVNGLKEYNPQNLINAISKKDELFNLINESFSYFKKTPTGIMIQEEDLKKEVDKYNINYNVSSSDLTYIFAMILLKNQGIITIPAVSMPGASNTIRFDMSSKDSNNLSIEDVYNKINWSFDELLKIIKNKKEIRELLFSL
ncbi:TIGR03576 family pyridoxal phosphate-dependent enzyme [Methanobrevibacter sp. DSM 116169]|uniref:TIGR03576 family pyridoxal phosphate-dependent enzyme n=1 Tax=Methanobrevibacter sp. DSM 116169 TaxID=3242727 RepID=UPI0038FC2112